MVIILSTFLAIFLLLGIVVLAKMIVVINRVNRITEKVENIANKAESMAEALGNVGMSTMAMKVFGMVFKRGKNKHRRG